MAKRSSKTSHVLDLIIKNPSSHNDDLNETSPSEEVLTDQENLHNHNNINEDKNADTSENLKYTEPVGTNDLTVNSGNDNSKSTETINSEKAEQIIDTVEIESSEAITATNLPENCSDKINNANINSNSDLSDSEQSESTDSNEQISEVINTKQINEIPVSESAKRIEADNLLKISVSEDADADTDKTIICENENADPMIIKNTEAAELIHSERSDFIEVNEQNADVIDTESDDKTEVSESNNENNLPINSVSVRRYRRSPNSKPIKKILPNKTSDTENHIKQAAVEQPENPVQQPVAEQVNNSEQNIVSEAIQPPASVNNNMVDNSAQQISAPVQTAEIAEPEIINNHIQQVSAPEQTDAIVNQTESLVQQPAAESVIPQPAYAESDNIQTVSANQPTIPAEPAVSQQQTVIQPEVTTES
ncbi:MAG: hypothetical protein HFE90_09680, partial [Firmicutes bacterium]|nr:hypothetical protein [Bacillota bacterium]